MATGSVRQVYLVADDVTGTAAQLEAALGLSRQFADGQRWVQFGAGPVSIAVSARSEAGHAPSGHSVPVLEVDDLDAAQVRAKEAGAELLERRDMGAHGAIRTIRLEAGHIIALFQRAPGSAGQ